MKNEKKDHNLKEALRAFFSGKKSEFGEKAFHKWFDSFDDSKGALNKRSKQNIAKHQARIYKAVKNELNLRPEKIGKNLPGSHIPRKQHFVFVRLVAILIMGSLLAAGVMYSTGFFASGQQEIPFVEKSNSAGQISNFTLPDGTEVWLNAGSTLRYPEVFGNERRDVILEGEAFFDAARDENRPLVVQTGSLFTRVLGTSFNIKAYPDDAVEEITLVSGEVEVFEKQKAGKQTLKPDQKIRFEKNSGLQQPVETDAKLSNAWTRRELVFIRENFATIAKTFERWYDVEFVFEDEELKEEVFVYHFKELSLANSMRVLKQLADFDFNITDDKVIVYKTTP